MVHPVAAVVAMLMMMLREWIYWPMEGIMVVSTFLIITVIPRQIIVTLTVAATMTMTMTTI